MRPTTKTYKELQQAYDHFNKHLFGEQLPDCLLTLQREKRSYGYFSPDRWGNTEGQKLDEIAMNPAYFAVVPLVEIMQTLCHEMAHLWQHRFGEPGRGRYHNAEWAKKMESIGLMPSSTGKPGGKKTGDHMADYPIEGGPFLKACSKLLSDKFKLSWYDRLVPAVIAEAGAASHSLTVDLPEGGESVAANEGVEITTPAKPNTTNRVKYTCSCKINVWGKPDLVIICGKCSKRFWPNKKAAKGEGQADDSANEQGEAHE